MQRYEKKNISNQGGEKVQILSFWHLSYHIESHIESYNTKYIDIFSKLKPPS